MNWIGSIQEFKEDKPSVSFGRVYNQKKLVLKGGNYPSLASVKESKSNGKQKRTI